MAKPSFSETQITIIKKLSVTIVGDVAPQEMDFVDDAVDEFLEQVSSESHSGTVKLADFEVAFNPDDISQSLVSPAVIAAVMAGLFKLMEIWVAQAKEKNPPTLKKDEKQKPLLHPQDEGSLRIPEINYIGLERELIGLLRSNGIGADRAKRIAQAFITLIAKDPSIVVSFSGR